MPRPEKARRICCEPGISYFKPRGVPIGSLEEIMLGLDEFEALRMLDFAQLGQGEVAKKMNVSQPTLSRIIVSARKKVSEAICEGKAIRIEGGIYTIAGPGMHRFCGCGGRRGRWGKNI
ncbi:MAG: DUF134 domain-containing protein [Candidatus Micrarchaeia archaeon]